MPRNCVLATKAVKFGLFLLMSIGPAVTLRAEPTNPLRPALAGAPALRIVPSGESLSIGNVTAVTDQPAGELKSVVPPQFGQPELLPSPGGAAGISQEHFGEPD